MRRPSDEFWSLSYREIVACMDAYRDEREEIRMLVGSVNATVMNSRRTDDRQHFYTAEDFFPRMPRQATPSAAATRLAEIRRGFAAWHKLKGTN